MIETDGENKKLRDKIDAVGKKLHFTNLAHRIAIMKLVCISASEIGGILPLNLIISHALTYTL